MSLTAALVGARFLHEAALLVVFGIACFPLYAAPGLARANADFAAWRRGRMAWGAGVATLSGVLWLALTTASMTGDAADAIRWSAIAGTVSDTSFGQLWVARLIGCVLLGLAVWTPRLDAVATVLSALLLASLAGTGHADLPDGTLGLVHRLADGAHLLAAGLWIGALWALGWMVVNLATAPQTEAALRRFSGAGQLAVAVIIITGGLNAYAILGDPLKLLTTAYGRLLDVKLAAFAGMLGLAALNRFVTLPRLAAGESSTALPRLRRQIIGEQALSAVVVIVVAVIGTIDPGG